MRDNELDPRINSIISATEQAFSEIAVQAFRVGEVTGLRATDAMAGIHLGICSLLAKLVVIQANGHEHDVDTLVEITREGILWMLAQGDVKQAFKKPVGNIAEFVEDSLKKILDARKEGGK